MRRLLVVPTILAIIGWAMHISCSSANAHFLWLDTSTAADGVHYARLIFSDVPSPAGHDLSAKISHSKLWRRTAHGEIIDLAFSPGKAADAKTLVATITEPKGVCIEASCDYGVYSHGGLAVMLHYFAKALPSDWQQCGDHFARSERLDLDVVPHCKDRTIALEVLYGKEKAAGQEVVVIAPSGNQHKLKTDAHGSAVFRGTEAGRYAVRAAYVEAERGGKYNGKDYSQTWTYCTATFDVAADGVKATPKGDAAEALAAARASRSVWTKDFPGFMADVAVNSAGEHSDGKLKVDGEGSLTLSMSDSKAADWARDQLESMVQHRMPDGRVSEGTVEFAADESPNPLGRKIVLNDGSNHSSYRIKDNVIMEVCRQSGAQTRFTISVLEVQWNAEHKYLPRSFVMNYFDVNSGSLTESDAYSNLWQRVGEFDIPSRIVEISAEKGAAIVRQIELRHIELLRGSAEVKK